MMGKHSTGKLGEAKSGAQKVQRSHSSQGELGVVIVMLVQQD